MPAANRSPVRAKRRKAHLDEEDDGSACRDTEGRVTQQLSPPTFNCRRDTLGPDAVWGRLGVWAIQTGVGLAILRMDTARATVRVGTSTAVRGPPYVKGVNPTIGMSLRLGQRWGGVAEMDRAFPDDGPAFTLTRAGLFVGW